MKDPKLISEIQQIIDDAVIKAKLNSEGMLANYIPELAKVEPENTSIAVNLISGELLAGGDADTHIFTLQSVSKLVVLAGLLSEFGADKVWSWVGCEPTGGAFSSIAQLETSGAIPSNPLVNAGAIALCARIPGNTAERLSWIDSWVTRLFGEKLNINSSVLHSEVTHGDKNRAIAYILKDGGTIKENVEEVLEVYFSLCSYEASIRQAVHLPLLLSRRGFNVKGQRVLGHKSVENILAVMATCGLYNESGIHLVRTGMPAKSGVSGLIVSVARGVGGIAVSSPRLNSKGGSVRGHIMLQYLAKEFDNLFEKSGLHNLIDYE